MATWLTFGLIPDDDPWLSQPPVGPIDLGNGVRLVELPAWLKTAPYVEGFAWEIIEHQVRNPRFALVREFQADDPSEADPAWKGTEHQTYWRFSVQCLMVANLAVWLARPGSTLRFQHVLWVGDVDGTKRILNWTHHDGLLARRPEEALMPYHLQEALSLNTVLASLDTTGPLWISVRSLWGALTELWFHNRYALAWMGLEALFGPRNPGEVTHRLSFNLAVFLEGTPTKRWTLYRQAKKDYGARSQIVHGEGEVVKDTEWPTLMHRAEDWLRMALRRILVDDTQRKRFQTAASRDAFFEAFAFSANEPA